MECLSGLHPGNNSVFNGVLEPKRGLSLQGN